MTKALISSELSRQEASEACEIQLSVVICTYNRAPVLEGTLESYSKLTEAHDERIELVIVDNNSTDATSRVALAAQSSIPGLRYFHEARQGLSHARNRGIQECRGSIIAFADDDVFFDTGWASAIIDEFNRHPTADALGGRSTPVFEGGRPAWLLDDYLVFYGDTGFGDQLRWLDFPEHPYGLNMAFRREVFEKVGHFDANLGRIKASLLSGEESDLFERIYAGGLRTLYSPKPHLFHRIPKERTSFEWIKSRFYWQGASDAIREFSSDKPSRMQSLQGALSALNSAIRMITGRNISPRRIYWHYSGLKSEGKVYIHYWIGKASQCFKLSISPPDQ